jgi:hypothetical protein
MVQENMNLMYVSFQILFQLEMINLYLCLSLFMLVYRLMILLLMVVMILVSCCCCLLFTSIYFYDVFYIKSINYY